MPQWISANDSLPTERKSVVVITTESFIPLMGYIRYFSDGPMWIIPGMGGNVEWWSDCVPEPYPDAEKEKFRKRV